MEEQIPLIPVILPHSINLMLHTIPSAKPPIKEGIGVKEGEIEKYVFAAIQVTDRSRYRAKVDSDKNT